MCVQEVHGVWCTTYNKGTNVEHDLGQNAYECCVHGVDRWMMEIRSNLEQCVGGEVHDYGQMRRGCMGWPRGRRGVRQQLPGTIT